MRLFALNASEVDQVWEDIRPLLERFSNCCQESTPERFRENLKASRQQLWGVQDAHEVQGILITEVIETVRGLVCVLVAACGKVEEAEKRALLAWVRQWAVELGCIALRIQGRKGWARWDRRFKQTGVVLEAPL